MSANGGAGGKLRLAYLATAYPALSHSFVHREVEALRARGAEIHTFALHPTDPGHLLTEADRDAQRTTYTVLPWRRLRFAAAHLRALLSGPGAYLRTLAFALSRPPGGTHGRLWQLFYFLEAVPVWHRCEQLGLTHVHAHFTSPSGDVAQLAARLGAARGDASWSWSFSAHGTDIFNDGPASLAAKVGTASLVVCVSDFGRSQLMRLAPEEEWEKVRLARCGLNGEWLRNGRPAGQREGALRLLTVGRLEREKGQAILLEALALLRRRDVDVTLEIVGDGSRLEQLQEQARALGIEGRVRFAGAVGQDRIHARYAAADAFCLPSLGEGIPTVLMEALACGLPAIASNTMGIPELISDGVTGLLVPPGRPDELADAIERLARDRELGARLGRAGRRRVAEEYSLERSADALESAFLQLPSARAG